MSQGSRFDSVLNEVVSLPLGSLNCSKEIAVSTPWSVDLKSSKKVVNIERSPFSYCPISYLRSKK